MITKAKPLFQCRLYPESKYLYFEAIVWKNKSDMTREIKAAGVKGGCAAICMSCRREDKNRKLLPHLGWIHLNARDMPYPITIHELGHAAIEWGRRKHFDINMKMESGFTLVEDGEERILRALSNMSFAFFEKWSKFKQQQSKESK